MITMICGTQGSGKTAAMVREMICDPLHKIYFSNIVTKNIKNNIQIKPEMIIKKVPVMLPNGKQAISKGNPMYKYSINIDFWKEMTKKYNGLNIIIDEAHTILNARRGMTKQAQPLLDWMSLLRRVLGSTQSGYGRLFLVTQIERRLDIVAKEQSTEVRYHLCHYSKTCKKCGRTINENNEVPDPMYTCPICNIELIKHSHIIEVWHFQDYPAFINWKYLAKGKTYFKHYYITDIEKVFPLYNTLQWDNLIMEV